MTRVAILAALLCSFLFTDAATACDRAARAMPASCKSLYDAGVRLYKDRRYSQACQQLSQAAQQYPDCPEVDYYLALCNHGLHRYTLAKQLYDKVSHSDNEAFGACAREASAQLQKYMQPITVGSALPFDNKCSQRAQIQQRVAAIKQEAAAKSKGAAGTIHDQYGLEYTHVEGNVYEDVVFGQRFVLNGGRLRRQFDTFSFR